MNILQVSPPKAGSFWLQTILKNILKKKELPINSYVQRQPIFRELKHKKLSFKEQSAVDMLDIEEKGIYYRISSVYKKEIRNLSDYASKATLAWTHSTYCHKTPEVFNHFDKKVIIVRDPRDRALSASRFAFTPYMQEYYPSIYDSPEEFLEGEFNRLLEQWFWFYGNYLLHHEELDLHFIFFERLLNNFPHEMNNLLDYLEISLSAVEKSEIEEIVSFSNMKKNSPQHLQKGKSRKWVNQLSEAQQKEAAEKVGFLMDLFGYSRFASQEDILTGIPKDIPDGELMKRLQRIDWRTLYEPS